MSPLVPLTPADGCFDGVITESHRSSRTGMGEGMHSWTGPPARLPAPLRSCLIPTLPGGSLIAAYATLAAPLHRHSHEDEYSFVLEGRMGPPLGDDVIYGQAGDLVFKPRQQWHSFWNPDAETWRILEGISRGGFEHFFDDLAAAMQDPRFDPAQLGELGHRYGLDFEPESVPRLRAEHGLVNRYQFPTPKAA